MSEGTRTVQHADVERVKLLEARVAKLEAELNGVTDLIDKINGQIEKVLADAQTVIKALAADITGGR